MSSQRTIVLVLRSGGDFSFRDVELISRHIIGKWKAEIKPRIICLWDKPNHYNMGNIEFIPLNNTNPGTWSRIDLYAPEMEQFRPFLYVDLDTAVINSIENIFDLVKDESKIITLEDFWQKGQIATGLVWFPKDNPKIQEVWDAWNKSNKAFTFRMDPFLREILKGKVTFWQQLTNTIYDFKPKSTSVLRQVPYEANLVCFHGKPRIFQAAEASLSLPWVQEYVNQKVFYKEPNIKKVTVIIPYNVDRGFLKEAKASVPKGVQLLVSQGDGYWGENFNKVLPEATGDYIKFLHEDDILTSNCIQDSIETFEKTNADFIHGDAIELQVTTGKKTLWSPSIKVPTLETLLQKNTIHSASLMYKREIFDQLGGFDGSLNVSEEYEFNLRCLKAGYKIGYVNSPLAIYRRHSKQKVRTIPTIEKNRERTQVQQKYSL